MGEATQGARKAVAEETGIRRGLPTQATANPAAIAVNKEADLDGSGVVVRVTLRAQARSTMLGLIQ
jgi:hypothetical protein